MGKRAATVAVILLLSFLALGGALFLAERHDVARARLNHALITAVDAGDAGAVWSLLARGADPNTRENVAPAPPFWQRLWQELRHPQRGERFTGRPVLIRAAADGRTGIVRLLLDHGADIRAKDNSDLRDPALDGGVGAVVGDSPTVTSMNNGETALTTAAYNERTATIQLLLRRGADVNEKDDNGDTALTAVTSLWYSWRTVQILLAAGADVNAVDHERDTPLINAVSTPSSFNEVPDETSRRCVEALIRAGANVNAKDGQGQTALRGAVQAKRVRTVEALLTHGANVEARAANGQTALSYAQKDHSLPMITLLQKAEALRQHQQ